MFVSSSCPYCTYNKVCVVFWASGLLIKGSLCVFCLFGSSWEDRLRCKLVVDGSVSDFRMSVCLLYIWPSPSQSLFPDAHTQTFEILFCEFRTPWCFWLFSFGHLKLLNQPGFFFFLKKQNQNETTHLRYLTPSKCQLIIALGEGQYKTSQPKDKQLQCVLWERLWYFIEKWIKESFCTHT